MQEPHGYRGKTGLESARAMRGTQYRDPCLWSVRSFANHRNINRANTGLRFFFPSSFFFPPEVELTPKNVGGEK